MSSKVKTIDLNFIGYNHAIAVYLIPHSEGVLLIESGPGSTLQELEIGLQELGYRLSDITDVFITHIHLDHAGAAGALAHQGARIHVHPKGAPHLIDPEKLLNSATRIYGDSMSTLWGQFIPVPGDKISIPEDGSTIRIGNKSIIAIYTPGHAAHHICYLFEDVCFSGDVGGCRISGEKFISVPFVPPEFHLESWRETVTKLRQAGFRYIAPTHYGIFDDVEYHINMLAQNLDEVEEWMCKVMPSDPPIDDISNLYQKWIQQKFKQYHLCKEMQLIYEAANPSFMASTALQRYWRKYRMEDSA